jgi:hypothetical protein
MKHPTEAELAALEDAARRADQARSDAEYGRLLVAWFDRHDAVFRDVLREFTDRVLAIVADEHPEWLSPEPDLDPDEPIPHRSRFRPRGPAEGR